jgi:hypothetical protein
MGVDVKQFGTTTLSALQVSPLLFWHSYAIVGEQRYSLTDFEGSFVLTHPHCFAFRMIVGFGDCALDPRVWILFETLGLCGSENGKCELRPLSVHESES